MMLFFCFMSDGWLHTKVMKLMIASKCEADSYFWLLRKSKKLGGSFQQGHRRRWLLYFCSC